MFCGVNSKKVNITDAEHFASYADSILNGITLLNMLLGEVLTKPQSRTILERFLVTWKYKRLKDLSLKMVYTN